MLAVMLTVFYSQLLSRFFKSRLCTVDLHFIRMSDFITVQYRHYRVGLFDLSCLIDDVVPQFDFTEIPYRY